jgi:TetR/AcrR family transcriptional regulator, repressor of fatR-cypB operon
MQMNVHSRNERRGPGRPRTGGKSGAILDAALALFAERGFHGAAIPEIAERAGVAAGTIYRHFASKEALVNAVYRRCKTALTDALFVDITDETPLRRRFHLLIRNLAGFARAEPRAFAFLELHHHGDYLDADSRALELRALVPIAVAFDRARRRGEILSPSPQIAISMVWGAFVGVIKASRLGYVTFDDAAVEDLERTCWRAIAADPEPHPAASLS